MNSRAAFRLGVRRRVVEEDVPAPWSPIPTQRVRRIIAKNEDMQIEVLMPTAYEEDRSIKIKDLATAFDSKIITHRRMAEQVAKELGFEQYDYSEEMVQIAREKAVTPDLTTPTLGAGDVLAGKMGQQQQRPGQQPPQLQKPQPGQNPGELLDNEDDDDEDDEKQQHRGELSPTAQHDFRKRG